MKAEIIGKPSKTFFHAAVKDMGIKPEEVCHINIGFPLFFKVSGPLVKTLCVFQCIKIS